MSLTPGTSAVLHVVEDELWGKPCLAYNFQLDIGGTARAALVEVQREVAQLLSVPLLLTPPETMHVSLFAVVYVHWHGAGKEAYWTQVRARTRERIGALCRNTMPFSLRLSALQVSERAIFARTLAPCEPIALLRRELSALLGTDAVPRPRHDLVHTTLVRFAAEAFLPLAKVRAIEGLPIGIDVPFDAPTIVRESVYPSLAREELERFPLAAET